MKLESISVAGEDANQSGVGKKFLIISISITVVLNIFGNILKSNFFKFVILIESRSNLDAIFLDKVPIFCYLFKGYYFCK